MDFLLNPWVISIIAMSVIVGNLAALKHLSKIRFQQKEKSDLDKLNELDKKLHPNLSEQNRSSTSDVDKQDEKK
ncbi:DUF2897 family protein [Vibrio cincinnatiensis]|jgi:hypothetical protein|uniref:DUF2897 domain-containing protein n=1 Tax=Vibrio cincinnatiensis DSM 19608 TaxID=1123491 RepID=A0A1T4MIE9_VIBCI|nr:DUF2897 family protein [Vibrio cincinnatiensis]MCG3725366.1 DUF2897 family protein [Vibrio cincinnatiensis]MCG3732414.1 DUF2897 family protein [Vibrio cincinnatiensis]MCG3736525.1 DUF2897 family protein [Vibrio cincinnatiensis]MCG3738545.1 DUF2897 family protein [Vibrio cincinnatiensis]MCG3746260.1 DUF2897 family protein [Vibrio cincinnatiensis]